MLKKVLITVALSALLGACATRGSDPIPAQADQLAAHSGQAAVAVRQREAKENIIAYYDADGDLSERAMPGGYYRVLLGRTAEGKPVVQDFYQDSRTKQINPVIIGKEEDVKNFSSEVIEGRVVWYTPQGRISNFLDMHAGKSQRAGYYDETGRLVLSISGNPEQDNSLVEVKGFHDNGQPMFVLHVNKAENREDKTYYYPNGNRLLQSNRIGETEKAEFWRENGSGASQHDVQSELRKALQRANYLLSKYLR